MHAYLVVEFTDCWRKLMKSLVKDLL